MVSDQVLECRKFAGRDADFVVVASRKKEGWTKDTTIVAEGIRLRVGESRETKVDGWLRTGYPLKVIRDIQVDRRIVHYDWPEGGPKLPDPDQEA